MATYTPVRLFQSQGTGTGETTVYTASGGVIVKQVVINNTSASPVTFGVSLVPSGGTAGISNRIFGDCSVAAGDVVILDLSQVMAASDFLSIKAGTGSVVTATCSGVTVT